MFKHEEDFKDKNMQITKFTSTSSNLEIINVYRSSKGKPMEVLNQLMKMLTYCKTVLITGDFNLCFMVNGKNRMTKGLVDEGGFQQLMREPTHVLGGHIDHVYWRDVSHHWNAPIL